MVSHDYEGASFPAQDSHGREYILTPLYTYHYSPDGEKIATYSDDSLEGLLTDDGRLVRRTGRQRYILFEDGQELILWSADAKAV